eukprot:365093-Chlamydomonas_euryale.AAC.12
MERRCATRIAPSLARGEDEDGAASASAAWHMHARAPSEGCSRPDKARYGPYPSAFPVWGYGTVRYDPAAATVRCAGGPNLQLPPSPGAFFIDAVGVQKSTEAAYESGCQTILCERVWVYPHRRTSHTPYRTVHNFGTYQAYP